MLAIVVFVGQCVFVVDCWSLGVVVVVSLIRVCCCRLLFLLCYRVVEILPVVLSLVLIVAVV